MCDKPTPKRRSSGGDTISYLREKAENDFALREQELELQKEKLLLKKQKEQAAQAQNQLLMQNMMQQNKKMMSMLAKLADKM